MRVLQYYPVALAGDFGSSISVRGWCAALAGAGVEVTLAVDAGAMRLPPPDGVRCVPLPHGGRGPVRLPRGLAGLVPGHDVMVVHGGWTPIPVAAARTAARAAVPYLTTPHGAYHPLVLGSRRLRKRAWARLVERAHLRNAMATHVFFEQERRHLTSLGSPGSTIVAPNGVTAPGGLRWDGGSGGYLAWLGRFDHVNKGLDALLDGLARLPPADRPALHLRGRDADGGRARLAEQVARLGLERWVTVGDPVYGDAKWSFLARASGFVYPSRFDACPTAVGEAAALGLPTLVGPFPLGQLMADRAAAVLCAPTAESVASGLRTLLGPRAASMGQEAARTVYELLRWDLVGRSWLRQVEVLLGHSPETRAHATVVDRSR